ncbi:GxxExxY protein [Geomesophilobacter sediminis]|uniref:GxxExxY protein n=1 Tax=Geomesophilobacter sediminis TaxID=2798584 RepID=UPI001F4234D1|nr:GxxExxY protein [Geomesophilobacter sediminis]
MKSSPRKSLELVSKSATSWAAGLWKVYENALLIALSEMGLKAQNQVPLQVRFREVVVGNFTADIVVEKQVLLELKAVKALASEHLAQVMNYLKATGIEVGLLINFGTPKLEYRRFGNRFAIIQQGLSMAN